MAFSTGVTVTTSLPSGVLDRPIPNVYTLPLMDMLVGVAEDRVAAPPVIEKEKSAESRAPLPPLVLNTASLKVTTIVLLSDAVVTEETVGTVLSFKFAVLLLWVVLAAFPFAS